MVSKIPNPKKLGFAAKFVLNDLRCGRKHKWKKVEVPIAYERVNRRYKTNSKIDWEVTKKRGNYFLGMTVGALGAFLTCYQTIEAIKTSSQLIGEGIDKWTSKIRGLEKSVVLEEKLEDAIATRVVEKLENLKKSGELAVHLNESVVDEVAGRVVEKLEGLTSNDDVVAEKVVSRLLWSKVGFIGGAVSFGLGLSLGLAVGFGLVFLFSTNSG